MSEVNMYRIDSGEEYYIAARSYLEAVTYFLNKCLLGKAPDSGFDCEMLDTFLTNRELKILRKALVERDIIDDDIKLPIDSSFKDLTDNLKDIPTCIYTTDA